MRAVQGVFNRERNVVEPPGLLGIVENVTVQFQLVVPSALGDPIGSCGDHNREKALAARPGSKTNARKPLRVKPAGGLQVTLQDAPESLKYQQTPSSSEPWQVGVALETAGLASTGSGLTAPSPVAATGVRFTVCQLAAEQGTTARLASGKRGRVLRPSSGGEAENRKAV